MCNCFSFQFYYSCLHVIHIDQIHDLTKGALSTNVPKHRNGLIPTAGGDDVKTAVIVNIGHVNALFFVDGAEDHAKVATAIIFKPSHW